MSSQPIPSIMAASSQGTMMTLPDEVLVKLLEFAALSGCPEDGTDPILPYRTRDILSIARTCRRFYRNVIPFNYYCIYYRRKGDVLMPTGGLEALRRTLMAHPELGMYCRELSILVEDRFVMEKNQDFETLGDIIPLLCNVKHFRLRGSMSVECEESLWKTLRQATQAMSSLEHLELSRWMERIEMGDLVKENCIPPTLKKLTLDGGCCSTNPTLEARDAASLSELTLIDFDGSAEDLDLMTSWSKSISHFDFSSQVSPLWDLPMFLPMLSKHKHSLQSLRIKSIPSTWRGPTLDLTEFTALEDVTLSRWQIGPKTSLSEAESKLLLQAPRLTRLTLDLEYGSQISLSAGNLGGKEVKWVRTLAEAAVACGSTLCEIRIQFEADHWARTEDAYPWDVVVALNDEFGPKGVAITAGSPTCSREAWETMVETHPLCPNWGP